MSGIRRGQLRTTIPLPVRNIRPNVMVSIPRPSQSGKSGLSSTLDEWQSQADEPDAERGNLQRYHYDSHNQLREYLAAFLAVNNFAKA